MTDTALSEALTLDDLRVALAPAVASAASFDGWTAKAVEAAAVEQGVDPALAAFAFRDGAMAMIEAWIASTDLAMNAACPRSDMALLPIRERIRTLVWTRLEAARGKEEALSRALAILSMPQNLRRAAKLGWRSADAMWRLAGDTAVDYNHYTKRATLAALYGSTLQVFAGDENADKAEARAFLDRRIAGVMRFEKVKSQLLRPKEERFSMTRLLGRLRYPAR
ncbi:COQ9 family protein [Novosphingobium sp. 9]|uniref:COQ9 family protein n=1 Tax=Novosphingobium sp. 9 TaxID=2025349 RepID=UPI0021B625D9|nr:COQ9 family protein [Novosphingobium sp. 9]